MAKVNEAAKVALGGSAKLSDGARRKVRTKSITVFRGKTVRFIDPGEKTVTLMLSRRGREVLRGLSRLRLAITGKATDLAGETVTSNVALTLHR